MQLYKNSRKMETGRDTKRRDLIGHALTNIGFQLCSYSPLSALAPHIMALAHCPLAPHIMALLQMAENPEEFDAPHMMALPERSVAPHMIALPLVELAPHMIALPPTNCVLPQTAGPDHAWDDPQTAEDALVRVTFPVFEL